MINKQKGFAAISIIIIGLLIIGGAVYYINSKSDFTGTKDRIIDIQEIGVIQDDENLKTIESEGDIYQNGTYPGFIKSAYQNSDGSVSISIDFYQIFSGKQAFLEAVKSYEKEKNDSLNWDAFKDKYSTYSELEKAIQTMSEEQFEELYYEITQDERNKNDGVQPGGILNAFPNGMIYEKNESTKVRTFSLDKNIIIALDDGAGQYFIDNSKFLQDKKYQEYNFYITTKNGLVTKIESIYRP